VTAVARTATPELNEIGHSEGLPQEREARAVWFNDGRRTVPVFARDDLRIGHVVKGPALIEEEASVTVLDTGHVLTMHRHGHMLIEAAE